MVIAPAFAAEPKPAGSASAPYGDLKLRFIGPAVCSGRVVAFAVHPQDRGQYYVAAASGGVWKTVNGGTTWTPIFDSEGSYSIGDIVLDPKSPNVVWVGTGENNSQRSVGYGDGVYRSDDGGKSWKKMGLEKSEHIGRIVIDPRNSDVVYVAAQGPLWGPGGDRGLYKTTDAGKTWKKVLDISENTGVTDVVIDPRNPDVLIAAAYQRRRHVWTLINGGPESALYKSTDGGTNWTKLKSGLPSEDLGRIGLAIAPTHPDTVYAIVESTDKKGGIFRSTDFGATWDKRNDYDAQAQYYARIFVDPKNEDRLYVMGVRIQVSDDGGKSLKALGERAKHVDNHVIWIDPANTNYYLVGCDGGIYESSDRGANWRFISNLPITQFYDVTVDNAGPFYHVYGGTQDNFTLGGPARTRSVHGITNADWFVTQDGDGFHSRVDPKDANIVYSEAQYGALVRFDRRTGQRMEIQPQPGKGEAPLRWNWDSPLLLSPHSNTRLYFGANRLFRSDDRGDTWKAISPDLTRQLDRNSLPVMGKLWGPDAVAKHLSTSFYGNLTALSESPKQENLLYAGTDDGLIQVTEDAGKNWRKIEKFTDVPERTYVSRILASQHDAATVYAAFDNHKNADFKPYLLKSTDEGKTWTSIGTGLPANGPVLAIAEDHVDANLLFAGTEFGLHFTQDGGKNWTRLKAGLPTIAVRDLAIQKQENDLVVGTFGRGIYVLDDYSVLRHTGAELADKKSALFPVKDALLYIPSRQYGLRGKAFQGASFYTADNPAFGATFTYYLKDEYKTKKQKRLDAEKEAEKNHQPVPYPTLEELRAEAEEEPPTVLLSVMDPTGKVIRTLTGPVTAGIHRVTWDLREPGAALPRPKPQDADEDVFAEADVGPLVMPGSYRVTLSSRVGGTEILLIKPVEFNVVVDGQAGTSPDDLKALHEFQQKVMRLKRAAVATLDVANDLGGRIDKLKKTLDQTPVVEAKTREAMADLEKHHREMMRELRGDEALRARHENTAASIAERIESIIDGERLSLAAPTRTQRDGYDLASQDFGAVLMKLRKLIDMDLRTLEKALDEHGAPWTPGRLPEWKEK
jgi:photosystem II stability/assembly factor-like uncharacterized protein